MTSKYEAPSPEQAAAVAGNSRLVAEHFRELTGKDMAPGRAGVAFLDGWIDLQRLQAGDAPHAKLAGMAACYLGEAMIADIGGRWIVDPEYGLGVELAPDLIAFPFNKTGKHFANGADDSVMGFFNTNAALAAHHRNRTATD